MVIKGELIMNKEYLKQIDYMYTTHKPWGTIAERMHFEMVA